MIYKKILLPTDGSENNKIAIEHAIDLAKGIDADVTALAVLDKPFLTDLAESIPLPEFSPELDEMTKRWVEYAVTEGKKKGVRITGKVVYGHPADEIVKISKDYDLIVMGSLGRTGVSHLLMGSVAEKVVRFAKCPVLVVRKPQDI